MANYPCITDNMIKGLNAVLSINPTIKIDSDDDELVQVKYKTGPDNKEVGEIRNMVNKAQNKEV